MNHVLVRPDGSIENYAFPLACLADVPKGFRVLPDNPPAFDPAIETLTRSEVVLPEMTEVPYTVTPIAPEVLAVRAAAALSAAVEKRLNETARQYRYKSYHAAMAYVGASVAKYDAEGRAFRDWASRAWAYVDQIEQDVVAGLRAVPTAEELLGGLPSLEIME